MMNRQLNKILYILTALFMALLMSVCCIVYRVADESTSDRLLLMLDGVLQGEMSKYGIDYEAEGVYINAGFVQKDCFGLFDGTFREKKIKIYMNNSDAYLFLPGASFCNYEYFDREKLVDFEFDKKLFGSMADSGKKMDIPVRVRFFGAAKGYVDDDERNLILHVIPSIGFNTIYVETKSGTTDYVNEKKGNSEIISVEFYDSSGELIFRDNGSIRSRGNTSFTRTTKKSYRVKLDRKYTLPYIGARSSFILQANSLDEANCRNAFSRNIADVLDMPYTPKLSFCEMFVNGEYAGIYTINDAVGKGFPDYISSLYEICDKERKADNKKIISAYDGNNYIFYGKDEENNTILLNNVLDKLNNSSDYGMLERMVDLESFADMYILNFLTGEKDINRYSTFYYQDDKRGLFCAGPIWDMDRSFGNASGAECICINPYRDGYPEKLMRFPEFRKLVTERYKKARSNLYKLADSALQNYMKILSPGWDRERHFIRKYGTFDSHTYEEALDKVKEYYLERLSLLDGFLGDEQTITEIKAGCAGEMRGVYIRQGETELKEIYSVLDELYEDVDFSGVDGGVIHTGKLKD